MSGRHAVHATLAALALVAAHAGTASAAQVTLEPSPAEARTFATGAGGWSSGVDYGGLLCVPGVTCPAATPTHETTGGTAGGGDGHLRNAFGTLLGVLSTTTIGWTSPSFVAPANVDEATLSVAVRPQIASLLTIGSLRLGMRVIDVADGSRSTVVAELPLTAASAEFAPVSAPVPTSALVAGRSYRVALDVALTTTVSAVAGGSVDLDDVELRLTDLEPPAGLTGSFQTSGPPRVEGAVDPLGQETTVTVEYGPTAAYGSTTAPVVVDGSGAQPFAIPLADLTPGATYHYRVVARNADGTTATADQVFVAPTPPTAAPPVVEGAGNRRERTVVFDRGADVVAATVEVVDGSGHVVAAFPDDDGDGVVAVTLPDGDGVYEVRVVRENAAEQRTTSDPVTVALDRAAPVAGPAPTVSGPPDALVVSFTRAPDAERAVVELLDADGAVIATVAVADGAAEATVALPARPGTYGIRVVQTDAAGNSAATPVTPVERSAGGGDGSSGDGSGGDGSGGGAGGDGSGGDGSGGTGGDGSGGTGGGGSGGPDGDGSGGGRTGGARGGVGGDGSGAGGTGGGTGGDGSGAGAIPLSDPGRFGLLLRQCFGGDLVLTDVTARGARIAVRGLSRHAPGSTVTIVDRGGRRVGRARIGTNGAFATVVRAPASKRARLGAGYRAVVAGMRSPLVRLRRANVLTAVTVRGATIAIRGRVDRARLGTLKRLRVFGGAGATACARTGRLAIVGKVAIDRRTGAYRLRVRAPKGAGRVVVRTQAFGTKLTSRSSFAVK
ncbi:hypothetical protein [Conexibacter arvalis]|uniref:Fibronectin type-III domain-containing protein n=1 Tax=Conexibacter arvalis TaxID=912552 RepID=A0A840IJI0_9ACTN|nr:hypothetical protein [Conexibacter arvalis]MBB4664916.1 hypothetical protein [Conexibacter arvalis]